MWVVGVCAEQSCEVVVVVVTRLMRLPAAQHVTRDTVTAALMSHCSFVTHILDTGDCDVEKRGLVTTIDATSRWKLIAF